MKPTLDFSGQNNTRTAILLYKHPADSPLRNRAGMSHGPLRVDGDAVVGDRERRGPGEGLGTGLDGL